MKHPCRAAVFVNRLEVALCFGWIDGRREALDDSYYLQRFTPPGSQQVVARQPREGRAPER